MFFGAPQCCGPGSKGAETQRNKEGPHKDAKAQRKYTFAAWRLCEKKKIACEKSKKEKRTKDKKRYGAQRRKEIRRDLTKTRSLPAVGRVQRKNPLRLGAFARKK